MNSILQTPSRAPATRLRPTALAVHLTFTALAAYFSTSAPINLGVSELVVYAELWCSVPPETVFAPLPGSRVSFNTLSGLVGTGTTQDALVTGLNIPLVVGTRCMVVFGAQSFNSLLLQSATGYAGGGVSIQ